LETQVSDIESTKEPRGVGVSLSTVRRVFPGGLTAVDGIDLNISPGEFIALLGPSGCGKSTLLRMIAGLDQPTSGEIRMSSGERCRLAYVFQDAYLLPWRSVLRNVALPLELKGIAKSQRLEAARDAIEQVGLSEFLRSYPAQLSGGMRMRVSLARALVTNPDLLLLDEPFAALDEITRAGLDLQLRDLWQARGMTVIFVTHSITEAAFLAQRAIVFTPRPARIVIDHRIDLPTTRDNALRGDARFARETGVLLEALERGGEQR
jgi:NitT/TauT family transport system ATP-binding protein